jgi:hypothetical protein
MRLIVPHGKSQAEVVKKLDEGIDSLFAGAVGTSIEIADSQKEWIGSTMHFSFTSRMGFIALPINGTVAVDDTNAVLDLELPALVKTFVGEDRIAQNIRQKVSTMLAGNDVS